MNKISESFQYNPQVFRVVPGDIEVELRQHNTVLTGQRIVLRPLTENDWDILFRWNNDPEVLYFVEGDEVSSRTMDEVQAIYRTVSQTAFCFMIEYDKEPIGECWLQQANLDFILQKYPDADSRRIDLMIGKKELWGRGIGTEIVRLLTVFAFEHEQADWVWGCDIADYNRASQKVFQKAGYQLSETIPQPAGSKARTCLNFVVSRETFI